MIYFHSVSVYQLLTLVLYKRKNFQTEETCLIIRDILLPKIRDDEFLNKEFDKVVIYGDRWGGKNIIEQEKLICDYYNKLFKEENVTISDGDTIFVGCAHNTFGMYLSIRGIHFTFLEDAAGLISRYWILDQINAKQLALKYELICKWGLINADSPFINKILCDFRAQEDGFDLENEKYIDFCVTKELGNVTKKDREVLMSVFTDIKEINIPTNGLILLTQHFANLRTLLFEEQVFIYQIFMDYFTGSYSVVIKPHPDDLMYYPLLFPNVEIIKEKFPAEFLPFLTNNTPQIMATISSTSIFSLRTCFPKVLELGTEFEKHFTYTHKYYVTLKLLEWLEINEVFYLGCDSGLITNLSEMNGIHIKDIDAKAEVYCIDEYDKKSAMETEGLGEKTIVFLNTNKSYDFQKIGVHKLWEKMVPIVIKKHRLRGIEKNNIVPIMDTEDEVFYVYSTDKKIRDKVRKFEMKKGLEASNIELEILSMTPEEERIRILEGILEATERKLLYYKELVEKNNIER